MQPWARYKETRQRRGIVKEAVGMRALFTALDRSVVVLVLPTAAAVLGRQPTTTEAHAARRAAGAGAIGRGHGRADYLHVEWTSWPVPEPCAAWR